jgi:hypothetical protein
MYTQSSRTEFLEKLTLKWLGPLCYWSPAQNGRHIRI